MKSRTKFLSGFVSMSLVFLIVAALFGGLRGLLYRNQSTIAADAPEDAVLLVIDPGHGGEDGGCSSSDGLLEKELNLSIAKDVSAILNAAGYPAVLTRTEDTLLYDMYGDRTDYKGYKKIYDLKNRMRFTEETEAKYFVSIHMNKFPDPQYSGLQVYYSPNDPGSVQMADMIQNYVQKYIQPENDRQTKKSNKGIYLLHRMKIPAVLVECGFLSNTEEATLLSDASYRKTLSLGIACAIMEYCAGNAVEG
ncbi:MAG: hypothetical protein HFE66_02990 [Clostridiales bacterium]|jgi:N-acetylmuramoyl-L-alanine amidase|nr:hypothetical protein [Clostridiales bacterium]